MDVDLPFFHGAAAVDFLQHSGAKGGVALIEEATCRVIENNKRFCELVKSRREALSRDIYLTRGIFLTTRGAVNGLRSEIKGKYPSSDMTSVQGAFLWWAEEQLVLSRFYMGILSQQLWMARWIINLWTKTSLDQFSMLLGSMEGQFRNSAEGRKRMKSVINLISGGLGILRVLREGWDLDVGLVNRQEARAEKIWRQLTPLLRRS